MKAHEISRSDAELYELELELNLELADELSRNSLVASLS